MLQTTVNFLKIRSNRDLFCIFLLLAGLMFSKSLLSISVFLISLNWLIDKNLGKKINTLLHNKAALVFLLIYGLHIIGLFYSSDFAYAMKDLRVKLPLLIFPVVFGSQPPFNKKQFLAIIHLFIVVVIFSSFVSLLMFLTGDTISSRNISPFMSHIRLSLLSTLTVFILLYLFYKSQSKKQFIPILYLFGAIFLAVFTVFILGSVNGFIFLFSLSIFWSFKLILKQTRTIIKAATISILFIVVGGAVFWVYSIHQTYFPKTLPIETIPDIYTEDGNPYKHAPDQPLFENGVPVLMYICDHELRLNWSQRSSLNIDSVAKNGFPVYEVLIRYLSSKNLRKDASGIFSLTDYDIKNIEQGIPHYKLAGKSPVEYRIYELFRGYYNYKAYGDPNDNSLFLRFEFWEAAAAIIYSNPLIGVGTGDVNQAYEKQYEKLNSKLEQRWRLRAHNQYLSMGVAFGIPGIILFLFALLYPPIRNKSFRSFYFITAFLLILISMLTEDTIETQIGATIFAFFLSFFMFRQPKQE